MAKEKKKKEENSTRIPVVPLSKVRIAATDACRQSLSFSDIYVSPDRKKCSDKYSELWELKRKKQLSTKSKNIFDHDNIQRYSNFGDLEIEDNREIMGGKADKVKEIESVDIESSNSKKEILSTRFRKGARKELLFRNQKRSRQNANEVFISSTKKFEPNLISTPLFLNNKEGDKLNCTISPITSESNERQNLEQTPPNADSSKTENENNKISSRNSQTQEQQCNKSDNTLTNLTNQNEDATFTNQALNQIKEKSIFSLDTELNHKKASTTKSVQTIGMDFSSQKLFCNTKQFSEDMELIPDSDDEGSENNKSQDMLMKTNLNPQSVAIDGFSNDSDDEILSAKPAQYQSMEKELAVKTPQNFLKILKSTPVKERKKISPNIKMSPLARRAQSVCAKLALTRKNKSKEEILTNKTVLRLQNFNQKLIEQNLKHQENEHDQLKTSKRLRDLQIELNEKLEEIEKMKRRNLSLDKQKSLTHSMGNLSTSRVLLNRKEITPETTPLKSYNLNYQPTSPNLVINQIFHNASECHKSPNPPTINSLILPPPKEFDTPIPNRNNEMIYQPEDDIANILTDDDSLEKLSSKNSSANGSKLRLPGAKHKKNRTIPTSPQIENRNKSFLFDKTIKRKSESDCAQIQKNIFVENSNLSSKANMKKNCFSKGLVNNTSPVQNSSQKGSSRKSLTIIFENSTKKDQTRSPENSFVKLKDKSLKTTEINNLKKRKSDIRETKYRVSDKEFRNLNRFNSDGFVANLKLVEDLSYRPIDLTRKATTNLRKSKSATELRYELSFEKTRSNSRDLRTYFPDESFELLLKQKTPGNRMLRDYFKGEENSLGPFLSRRSFVNKLDDGIQSTKTNVLQSNKETTVTREDIASQTERFIKRRSINKNVNWPPNKLDEQINNNQFIFHNVNELNLKNRRISNASFQVSKKKKVLNVNETNTNSKVEDKPDFVYIGNRGLVEDGLCSLNYITDNIEFTPDVWESGQSTTVECNAVSDSRAKRHGKNTGNKTLKRTMSDLTMSYLELPKQLSERKRKVPENCTQISNKRSLYRKGSSFSSNTSIKSIKSPLKEQNISENLPIPKPMNQKQDESVASASKLEKPNAKPQKSVKKLKMVNELKRLKIQPIESEVTLTNEEEILDQININIRRSTRNTLKKTQYYDSFEYKESLKRKKPVKKKLTNTTDSISHKKKTRRKDSRICPKYYPSVKSSKKNSSIKIKFKKKEDNLIDIDEYSNNNKPIVNKNDYPKKKTNRKMLSEITNHDRQSVIKRDKKDNDKTNKSKKNKSNENLKERKIKTKVPKDKILTDENTVDDDDVREKIIDGIGKFSNHLVDELLNTFAHFEQEQSKTKKQEKKKKKKPLLIKNNTESNIKNVEINKELEMSLVRLISQKPTSLKSNQLQSNNNPINDAYELGVPDLLLPQKMNGLYFACYANTDAGFIQFGPHQKKSVKKTGNFAMQFFGLAGQVNFIVNDINEVFFTGCCLKVNPGQRYSIENVTENYALLFFSREEITVSNI